MERKALTVGLVLVVLILPVLAVGPAQGTLAAGATGPSSKHYKGDGPAASLSGDVEANVSAAGSLLACGASGFGEWTTTSSSFGVIRQCTLSLPEDGWVFISADGWVQEWTGSYEAQFEIDIDSTTGDTNIDRYVNVYDDVTFDGADKSAALTVLKEVTAGTHAFYFLGRRSYGTGTVWVVQPTLSVIYIPASSSILHCGASGNLSWSTTSPAFDVIRQCSLAVPQEGWVFIATDGWLAYQDGEYEAQFEIDIDGTSGDTDINRWVNVYDDGHDGTDKSVALSVLKPVEAGEHDFYFLGGRWSGEGSVLVNDPTLSVIYIPAAGDVLSCGVPGGGLWTTTSGYFETIWRCDLSVPQAGWVFVSADGSLGRQDGEYAADLAIEIVRYTTESGPVRRISVYDDGGDGTDESVALSILRPVTAGEYAFFLKGKRYSAMGTTHVLVYDPTLSVLFIPWPGVFVPLVLKGW